MESLAVGPACSPVLIAVVAASDILNSYVFTLMDYASIQTNQTNDWLHSDHYFIS